MKCILFLGLFLLTFSYTALASEDFPVEGEMRQRVDFWKRVYTEITYDQAFLHDPDEPWVVYSTVDLPKPSRQRLRILRNEKKRLQRILRSMAKKTESEFNLDEKKMFRLIGDRPSARLYEMAREIRVQNGLKKRYYQGLIRSYRYMDFIKSTFKKYGVPQRGRFLPHVESSFNYNAYSKVGAAGMWQFMRSTGRIYGLKINYIIDERRDPFKATDAAARLLRDNYRQLNSWPLAFTAYNHGAQSMKRAKRTLGTDNINTIIQKYKNRRFGFASKNFYATFMATVEISEDPEKYFPSFTPPARFEFSIVKVPKSLTLSQISQTIDISLNTLKEYNPEIRRSAFRSPLYMPRNFNLKIPKTSQRLVTEYSKTLKDLKIQREKLSLDHVHVIGRGESLYYLSKLYRVSLQNLIEFNNIVNPRRIYPGMKIKIPSNKKKVAIVTPKKSNIPSDHPMLRPDLKVEAKPRENNFEKYSQLLTSMFSSITKEEEPRDSFVLLEDYNPEISLDSYLLDVVEKRAGIYQIHVEPDETLGHYGEWAKIKTQSVRNANRMSYRSHIRLGQKLLIPVKDIEDFNKERLEFHLSQQEDFYSNYKVINLKEYRIPRGMTLSRILYDNSLPYWLLRKVQKNPNDLNTLNAGQVILLPEVEEIAGTEE